MARVRLLGGLHNLSVEPGLAVAAAAVRELIERLAEIGGERAAALLYQQPSSPEPALNPDLRVLVNGRDVDFLRGMETELREEDRVTLYLHGGRGFPGG